MTYDKMIKKAINEKLTMSQGNYQVVYDKKTDQSHVYMFGNEIFIWDHEQKKHVYDFCGYIGYPKTTRAINYCLDAVGADFRVQCICSKSSSRSGMPGSQLDEIEVNFFSEVVIILLFNQTNRRNS